VLHLKVVLKTVCILMFQVEAVDIDEGLNGRVEYRLASGDDHGHFVLNSHLGTLHVASSLDREQVTTDVAFFRTIITYVLVLHLVQKKSYRF